MSQVHYPSLAMGRQDIRFHEAKDYWGEGCCVLSRSVVSDSATPCTVGRQAPLSMEFLQARILEWVAMASSRGSSQPRDRIQVSRIAGRLFTL